LNGTEKQGCDHDVIPDCMNMEIKTRDINTRKSIPSSENEKEPCN
jgi:hypothetical protein